MHEEEEQSSRSITVGSPHSLGYSGKFGQGLKQPYKNNKKRTITFDKDESVISSMSSVSSNSPAIRGQRLSFKKGFQNGKPNLNSNSPRNTMTSDSFDLKTLEFGE